MAFRRAFQHVSRGWLGSDREELLEDHRLRAQLQVLSRPGADHEGRHALLRGASGLESRR